MKQFIANLQTKSRQLIHTTFQSCQSKTCTMHGGVCRSTFFLGCSFSYISQRKTPTSMNSTTSTDSTGSTTARTKDYLYQQYQCTRVFHITSNAASTNNTTRPSFFPPAFLEMQGGRGGSGPDLSSARIYVYVVSFFFMVFVDFVCFLLLLLILWLSVLDSKFLLRFCTFL